MSFIHMIPPGKATGETKDVYRYMAEVGGSDEKVPKIVQAFSLRPGSMRKMIRNWELGMWIRIRQVHGRSTSECFYCEDGSVESGVRDLLR